MKGKDGYISEGLSELVKQRRKDQLPALQAAHEREDNAHEREDNAHSTLDKLIIKHSTTTLLS